MSYWLIWLMWFICISIDSIFFKKYQLNSLEMSPKGYSEHETTRIVCLKGPKTMNTDRKILINKPDFLLHSLAGMTADSFWHREWSTCIEWSRLRLGFFATAKMKQLVLSLTDFTWTFDSVAKTASRTAPLLLFLFTPLCASACEIHW